MSHQSLILTLLLLLPTSTASAIDPIVTDRPDVAESSLTVGEGRQQIESGLDVQFEPAQTTLAMPTKIRFGLNRSTEMHLESDLFAVTFNTPKIAPPAVDFGGKHHITSNDLVSIGVLVALTIPLDGGNLWNLSPTLAADWDFSIFSLGTNIGADITIVGPASAHTLRYAAALGKDLSDSWAIYLEHFGQIAISPGVDTELAVDFGTTYLISPTLQWDLYGRVGINDAAQGVGIGSGFSAKF